MASLRERLMGRDKQQPKPGANGKPGEAPTATPSGGTPIPPQGSQPTPTGPIRTGPIPTGPLTGPLTGAVTGASTRPTSRTTQQTSRTAPTTGRTTGGRTFGSRGDTPVLSPVEQLKVDLHRRLIERLDLEALEKIQDEGVLIQQIRNAVVEFLKNEKAPLSQAEREEVIEQIVYEVTGLGPIEPLFRDLSITDILVNGPKDIYVERKGKLSRVPTNFRNNAHLLAIIDRIVSRVGRRVDESSPMVDARLPDGSRVNAIIPPLALDGPVLSIRRFGAQITIDQLLELGAMTSEMVYLLAGCVQARLNILISGGTGSGKTTLLNALSSFIPASERVVTIEDAAELRLQQEHVVRLETRPPNAEGRGEVLARDLVKNALRMRPDRIIVGEVRGSEALDMLQAMNTGHEGSLTTIHANSPRDAMARIETMIQFAGTSLPSKAMREQISSALDLIIQVSRLSDGTRRVTSVTEVTSMEGEVISAQEIFRFRRQGVANDGTVVGRFEATGVRPGFTDRLRVAGVDLPSNMFSAG
jgi:pilus assembly protein CpaF